MSQPDEHAHPDHGADAVHGDATDHADDTQAGHGGGHGGHGSGHGAEHSPSEPLGPLDSRAWAAGLGGAALAIIVVVALYLTISG